MRRGSTPALTCDPHQGGSRGPAPRSEIHSSSEACAGDAGGGGLFLIELLIIVGGGVLIGLWIANRRVVHELTYEPEFDPPEEKIEQGSFELYYETRQVATVTLLNMRSATAYCAYCRVLGIKPLPIQEEVVSLIRANNEEKLTEFAHNYLKAKAEVESWSLGRND